MLTNRVPLTAVAVVLMAFSIPLAAIPATASAQDKAEHTPNPPEASAPAEAMPAAAPAAPAAGATAKPADAPAEQSASAAPEDEYVLPELHWSFDGVFGTYDRAALQRGFQVYREVCSGCHSMNQVAYRNLADLGYNDAEIKAIAASVTIKDGPNDEGEMFDRPGKPSDYFKAPFPNVQAAKAANNGALPPDMSLLAAAREGGANYIYSIMTGYEDAPANKPLLPGQYWNRAMRGHVIAMPPPLSAGRVVYGDGTNETVDQYARDVAQFLTWASDPTMEERKRTGIKAFLFLLAFAGIMYGVKRKIWADMH